MKNIYLSKFKDKTSLIIKKRLYICKDTNSLQGESMNLKAIFAAVILSIGPLSCYGEDPTVFMGVINKENDATIPSFLRKIDELDYDKKAITLRIDVCNDNPELYRKINTWCSCIKDKYAAVSIEKNSASQTDIKTMYLHDSEGYDYLFIVSSDIFLNPFTLRTLADKNLPIASPLLRPIPDGNDLFRNFFLTANESGFYQENPEYYDVMERKKIGTFEADCVHGAYLIQTRYNKQLAFGDGSTYDCIAFSNAARKNQVQQYICNEKEFGFFLRYDEPKNFSLPALDRSINQKKVIKTVSLFGDKAAEENAASFPADQYSVYQVNDSMFCADDKWDWIKSNYIKKGLAWEPYLNKVFSQYVKPGDVVVDIGGNIGTHTMNLAKLVGLEGRVHVFEPQMKLYTELLMNMKLNHSSNVIPYRVALGASERSAELVHPCSTNEGMGYIDDQGDETVVMRTLDSYCLDNVSLIKINIEGYEIEALKGSLETIERNKPVLVVEIFGTDSREDRLNFIRGLGYSVSHLEGNSFLCIPKGL
jgi:FkbM family methyltransferase